MTDRSFSLHFLMKTIVVVTLRILPGLARLLKRILWIHFRRSFEDAISWIHSDSHDIFLLFRQSIKGVFFLDQAALSFEDYWMRISNWWIPHMPHIINRVAISLDSMPSESRVSCKQHKKKYWTCTLEAGPQTLPRAGKMLYRHGSKSDRAMFRLSQPRSKSWLRPPSVGRETFLPGLNERYPCQYSRHW